MRRYLPQFSPKKITNPRSVSPSSLTELVLWLDASQGVTTSVIPLYVNGFSYSIGNRVQAADANYYVCILSGVGHEPSISPSYWELTTDGATSLVTKWEDQSGNSRDVVAGGYTSRPTLISNSINNNPAIRFDGVDDYLGNSQVFRVQQGLPYLL